MKEKSQYFVVDDFFVREVRVCATVLEDPPYRTPSVEIRFTKRKRFSFYLFSILYSKQRMLYKHRDVLNSKRTVVIWLLSILISFYRITVNPAVLKHEKRFTSFKITTKRTPRGVYKLKCRLDDTLTVDGINFDFYNTSGTVASSLVPDKVAVKTPVNVSVQGTGFQNTAELRCFWVCGKARIKFFRAVYVDSNTVVCFLPGFETSRKCLLGVSLSKIQKGISLSLSKTFIVHESTPTALSAQFYNCLGRIKITFSKNVKANGRSKSCSTFFNSESRKLLGKRPICQIKGKALHAILRGSATLMPGGSVVFLTRSVKGVSAANKDIVAPTEKTLVVVHPSKTPPFEISLLGPSRSVGMYVFTET